MSLVTALLSLSAFSPQFVKEAEIKHGRVAMLAAPTIALLDLTTAPTLGVNALSSTPIEYQLLLLGIFGTSEISQLCNSYNFPDSVNSWFNMKEDHEPGNYKFDPLNISNSKNKEYLKTNELFIGRVAMIGTIGMMSKELIDGKPCIEIM